MRRGRLLTLLFLLSNAVGCAEAEQTTPTSFPSDTGGKRDTGSLPIDTGSIEEDTGTTTEDTGSVDTSAPIDTGVDTATTADSGTDSTAVDTTTPDTTIVADTTVDDISVADTSVVTDTAPSETGTGPTRVYTGSSLVLHGVTTDDYAVVSDSSGATWAVPLAGGTAQSVGTATSSVLVSGSVVFAWGATDFGGFAPLRVWSAATSSKTVATKSLPPGTTSATYFVAAASKDGAYIFFTDNAVTGSSDRADLKVARTDGTSVRTVFTQDIIWDGTLSSYAEACAPYSGWVGTRFVTTHCTPSGSAASFDVSAIDPATGTATTLGTDVDNYWSADEAGTRVATVVLGTLRIMSPTGSGSTLIDSGVSYGVFTRDGSAFVYRTTSNALKRSPSTSSAPITLVSSGVTAILTAPSADDKWILYAGAGSSGAYDIRRASTTSASSLTLHATANADVYGAGFTADGAYAIYYTAVTSIGVGNLVAYPMSGGSPTTLGTGAWYDVPVSGSKLVFNDNHVGTSSSGTATLRARDVAGGSGSIIAASADRSFNVTAARDRVVYVISSGTDAGLWVAAVP